MTTLTYSLAALLMLGAVSAATAQPAPAQPGLGGPVVPGVCLMSREAVLVNSSVGKAASDRLSELTLAAQTEVDTQRKPLETEAEQLQTDMAKLSPEQRVQRQQALAQKAKTVQALAELRGREIEATRQKALDRISTEAQTAIASVYKTRGCGLLIDRNSVLGGNLTNDITTDVVKTLDAKMTTITFEREILTAGT